jgi:hypothetical protein
MTDLVTRIDSMSDGEERKRGVEAEREPNFLLARFERRFLPLTVFDAIGLGIVAVMLALLGIRVSGSLRELAKEEPSAARL